MHIHSNFLGFLINIIHNNLKQDEQNLIWQKESVDNKHKKASPQRVFVMREA